MASSSGGKRDSSTGEFGLLVGVTIALVALVAVMVLMVVVYCRKISSDECSKKQPSDCDTLEYAVSREVLSSLQTDHHPPLVPSGRCKCHQLSLYPYYSFFLLSLLLISFIKFHPAPAALYSMD